MPPIVAAALTFGSFGDILEAARIAKRIIDALRNAPGGSHRRRKAIATLEALCDDMAKLTLLFHEGNFTDRLWTEVHLCRVLVDEFSAKLHSYEAAGLAAFFGRIRMATLEERELSSWMARIWERRAALHDLLLSLHSRRTAGTSGVSGPLYWV
ncbi:hypothetical protein C8J57DRAFT_161684 [Mycena rebaudengoi]|nr:hypothetical protein C8J57DRAFT_161684 [Mycena rebaudengoi]